MESSFARLIFSVLKKIFGSSILILDAFLNALSSISCESRIVGMLNILNPP